MFFVFFFRQKTAYELRISDWSSDVCSSDLGHELKLVYPQAEARPEAYAHLDFQHFFLQPMDGPARAANTEQAVQYCLQHPQWRLSLQTHIGRASGRDRVCK